MGIGTIIKWLGIGGLAAAGTSVVAPGAVMTLMPQSLTVGAGANLMHAGVTVGESGVALGELSAAAATSGYALEKCQQHFVGV